MRRVQDHLFHFNFLLSPHSVLWCGCIHVDDLFSGPAASDEHLRLKVEGAQAIGGIEGHAVLQFATIGQELPKSKLLFTSLTQHWFKNISLQACCHLEILHLKNTSHGWNTLSGIYFPLILLNDRLSSLKL